MRPLSFKQGALFLENKMDTEELSILSDSQRQIVLTTMLLEKLNELVTSLETIRDELENIKLEIRKGNS